MKLEFLNEQGDFKLKNADRNSYLYFPIGNDAGVMGSIAPDLHGDSKTGQNTFFMEPVSVENLHTTNMGRNFWVRINDRDCFALAGNSPMQLLTKDEVTVTAGQLWHKVVRRNVELGVEAVIVNYCPVGEQQVEIMKVTLKNISGEAMVIEATAAIPIYGRSADNYRDHRHVTALLHRTTLTEDGVVVKPTLSFDERGHKENEVSYGVHGRDENFQAPVGFIPRLQDFIGEGGSLNWPAAVVEKDVPLMNAGDGVDGYETIGALRFAEAALEADESKTYYLVLSYNEEGLDYLKKETEAKAFQKNLEYWNKECTIHCKTGDENFDYWLKWVGIQPTLRRIYGCSFLPHHDYGRGGRGFRDLWQDSLALLLMNPDTVRENLISYYGGIRMDGSNATIIGTKPGEFIADRNSIIRLWMDHGLWPFITTYLYVNQTGDADMILTENTYFKDGVSHRGEGRDLEWDQKTSQVTDVSNDIYKGSILEHILLQHLTVFFDVGEHNHMKLRGADWNDALDMAKENGESVAFSAAYAGNLDNLSQLFSWLKEAKDVKELAFAKEMTVLMNQTDEIYDSVTKKQALLNEYCDSVKSHVSGERVKIELDVLIADLRKKAEWIREHIRKTEWISDGKENQWFNSYYDNNKRQVEGSFADGVRMMLTGQVFTIMGKTATNEQVERIVKAADEYLYEEGVGGYRLNTNFHEVKKDLGRMFGFAYGHKENGAVFSHMAVMYGYALYSRGFAREGYKVLNSLFKQSFDFEVSRMYPGIPEYFNDMGRGMYQFLTGAASWFMLTTLTQVFGVKGVYGDLSISPNLVVEQFGEGGVASITSNFAGKEITVIYENEGMKDVKEYQIVKVYVNGMPYAVDGDCVIVKRADLEKLDGGRPHVIRVVLG